MRLCDRVLFLIVAVGFPSLLLGCQPDPSDRFFSRGVVPELRIRLSPKQEERLRADPRRYVECTLVEDDKTTHEKVRVKLKGRAGSFRDFDDQPALTVSFKKTSQKKAPERFHGLAKFHLNNSVQDPSYLNELIASQLCAEAGCPTARATHARVWLNDRDLGLYVLKEGYDDVFLARHFANPKGNLYDGVGQEIDDNLEKDEGEGPDDGSDIKALAAACREEDPQRRWALIEERLDIDAFINFVAIEMMLCHWDGYAMGLNNYRVYFRADNKKACFFPHGMDQIIGDSNYGVYQTPNGLVARAVLENPDWNAKYHARVEQLLPLFDPAKLQAKIDAGLARIRPSAEKIGEEFAHNLEDRVREFKERASERQERILNPIAPEPLAFDEAGWAQIEGWEPHEPEDAKLEEQEHDGRACLLIEVGPSEHSTASFRTKVTLAKGSYRLEANVKTINVDAIADERGPGGAGVRISGAARENQAAGSSDWQMLSHAFEIDDETREVELIAELRSRSGSAFFEIPALRLVKTK